MSELRRYEIFLPRRFNDGTKVPTELIVATILELRRQFGAVSCETQITRGYWTYEEREFRDEPLRVFVDVAATEANRRFFTELKETLKARFQQIDIWITTDPIEVL